MEYKISFSVHNALINFSKWVNGCGLHIVRFTTERLRDDVFKARTTLKLYNNNHRDSPIYINDDLTARRAKLSFDTRILKREKRIQDCWTAFGKVVIKTTTNLIKEIKSQADLQNI